MNRKRHTPEQVIRKIRDAEKGILMRVLGPGRTHPR